jgi:hypothetical protein
MNNALLLLSFMEWNGVVIHCPSSGGSWRVEEYGCKVEENVNNVIAVAPTKTFVTPQKRTKEAS